MSSNLRIVETFSYEDTYRLGQQLATQAVPGQVICLTGDLGTGKTVFTQGFARGLGVTDYVDSPTFTIVKEYTDGRMPLYHFDVYRVSDPDELFNIGIDEYFFGEGVCIVEWADLILDILPENTKYIYLAYGENEGERVYKCTF